MFFSGLFSHSVPVISYFIKLYFKPKWLKRMEIDSLSCFISRVNWGHIKYSWKNGLGCKVFHNCTGCKWLAKWTQNFPLSCFLRTCQVCYSDDLSDFLYYRSWLSDTVFLKARLRSDLQYFWPFLFIKVGRVWKKFKGNIKRYCISKEDMWKVCTICFILPKLSLIHCRTLLISNYCFAY